MFRVRLNWIGVGGVLSNSIMHFDLGGASAFSEQAQGCVNRVESFWADVREYFASTTSMQVDPEVFLVTPETGEVSTGYVTGVSARTPGDNLSAAVPQAAQVLLRGNTGTRRFGRKVIGHVYLPGFAVNGMGAGEVGNAAIETISTAAESLLAPTSNTYGVWSRPDLLRARVGDFTPATSFDVWNEFATLRKRRS